MRLRWTLPFAALVAACVPRGDLDDAAAGEPPSGDGGRGATGGSHAATTAGALASSGKETGGATGGAASGGRFTGAAGVTQMGGTGSGGAAATSGGSVPLGNGGVSNAAGSGGEPVAGSDPGPPPAGGVASASGGASSGGGAGGFGGVGGSGASSGGGAAGHGGGDAPSLPLDLPNTPVTGTFTVSTEASWEVDGVFVPTFEIHTPTASYWLVKSLGVIVSMVDKDANDARQWIDFSSAFRPLRGLPSFGSFDSAGTMSCVEDEESQTPTHLRIDCATKSKSWRLVWDFFPTHVTLTVNAAPSPFGVAYRGVPGGLLDTTDRFVSASGAEQSAMTSSVTDWPGAAEWAYVSDPVLGRSLFAIHHGDDELTDRYQVKDNDSALISFGDGLLSALPKRFSFGLIASSSHAAVQARADFVIRAIR